MALPHSGGEPPGSRADARVDGIPEAGPATLPGVPAPVAGWPDPARAGPAPSDAFLASLFRRLGDAIVAVDAKEHITWWSRGAEELLGFTAAEVLGHAVREVIDLRPFGAPPPPLAGLFRGETFDGEWTARSRAGRLLSLEVRASSLRGPAGEPGGFVAVIRNASEHRRALADLREAVRLRDEVLGVVAHDLRSPLNLIVLEAELLRGSRSAAASRSSVESIFGAARRMDRLIEDLLDMELLQSGTMPLPRDALPPRPILCEAIEALSPLATAAGLTLVLQCEAELPAVTADRFRLLQILDNLIGNAIKYTPSGGRVVVSAAVGEGRVEFAVADTGCGIEAESLPRVFERFFRSASRPRGAGLGLAIVKSLVDAYGGCVGVTSTVGVGSTFRFTIPTAPNR